MQNINEIKHHIRAVEQTRKITNAMHLVSSARMKKVMPHIEYNRRYFRHVQSAMHHILAASGEEFQHPYLQARGDKRNVYIVVSGDKGMVGAYNANVLKFALSHLEEAEHPHLIAVGITASHFFNRKGIVPDIEIIGVSQDPSLYHARQITQGIFQLYNENIVDQVFVIYTSFVNTASWQPCIRRLLPVDAAGLKAIPGREEMIYHPSPEEMFDLLVPQYTIGILFGALTQAYASEHCARMMAMQSATRNADELLKKLKTRYNMARQAAITQEIIEITSAAQAITMDRGRM